MTDETHEPAPAVSETRLRVGLRQLAVGTTSAGPAWEPLRIRFAPREHPEILVAVAAAVIASVVSIAAGGDWRLTLGFAACGLMLVIGLRLPLGFLALLIVVRPLFDSAADRKAHVAGLPGVNLAGAVALVCLAVVAWTLWRQRARLVLTAGAWAFGGVLAISAVAAAIGTRNYHAIIGSDPVAEWLRVAAIAGVYVLTTNLSASRTAARVVLTAIGVAGVVPACVGIYQLIHGIPVEEGLTIGRIWGTFVGPNPLAGFIAIPGLVLIAAPTLLIPYALRLVCLAPIFVALVETFSREGWIMFGLGAVLLTWRERQAVLVALVAASLLTVVVSPGVRGRLLSHDEAATAPTAIITVPVTTPTKTTGHATRRYTTTTIATPTSDSGLPSSYSWRLETWRLLLDKWKQRPIIGYGLRTVPTVNPRSGFDAHNSAVKLLVEGGVLLLAAYVLLVWAIVRRLWAVVRARTEASPYAALALVVWGVVLLVALTSDDPLSATASMYALFALTGVVEALGRAVDPARAGVAGSSRSRWRGLPGQQRTVRARMTARRRIGVTTRFDTTGGSAWN